MIFTTCSLDLLKVGRFDGQAKDISTSSLFTERVHLTD
jgi:hypothetical protein